METTWAYLAGVIDADGYITVHRSTKNRTVGKAAWAVDYYAPRVGIAGTRREPHDLAKATFGGQVTAHSPKNLAHRTVFSWAVHGQEAAAALRLLRPYLLVKSAQADLVIALAETITRQFSEVKATTTPPYRIPPEMVAERTRIWREVTGLNEPRNRRVHHDDALG